MPTTPTAVYDTVQIAIGLLGLVVLALYFAHPKLREWRQRPVAAPAWTSLLSDSLLLLGVALGAILAGNLLGVSVARMLPGGKETGGAMQVLAANIGMFAAVPLAISLAAWYLRSHGTAVAPVNAERAPAPLDAIGLGFLTFLAAAPLVVAVAIPWQLLLKRLDYQAAKQPVVELLMGDTSPGVRLGLVLTAVLLAPVTEELVFRAGVFRCLRGWLPRWVAIAASSLLFASLHLNVAALLPLAVLGAVWAHAYEKTGSIVVVIVAHGLFNLLSISLMLSGHAPV